MTFIWLALDALDEESERVATLATVARLSHIPGEFGSKINDDYVQDVGMERAVRSVLDRCPSRPIFLDLKMFKGKRTMCSAVEKAAKYGVSVVNVYTLADTELPPVIECAKKCGITLAALTVLSHFDDAYCRRHFNRFMPDAIRHFAVRARELGISTVILPGEYLWTLEGHNGFRTIVTGIRPKEFRDNRHRSEVTPEEVAGRADMAVVGSPIMKSADPEAALCQMLTALGQ